MGNHLGNAATFLIEVVFGFYILIVMLRFLLQWARADFYNPVSQFMVKATQPVIAPMRRVIPGLGGVDLSALLLMVALQFLELVVTTWILGVQVALQALLVLTVAELLQLAIYVFIFAILVQVVISWINPGAYNPILGILHSLTEPLLGPARRMIPPISGLDLSPLVVLIVLQLTLILVVAPIRDLARAVA